MAGPLIPHASGQLAVHPSARCWTCHEAVYSLGWTTMTADLTALPCGHPCPTPPGPAVDVDVDRIPDEGHWERHLPAYYLTGATLLFAAIVAALIILTR